MSSSGERRRMYQTCDEARVVERGGEVGGEATELVAVGVLRQHREPRLSRAQRQLFPAELDPGGEDLVLQRVLPVGQLGDDEARLARLPHPVEPLALVSVSRARRRLPQSLELLAGEE